MTRCKKSKAGRPSLGAAARKRLVTVKLSEAEYQAIAAAVAKAGPPATVSSWLREGGLARAS